MLLKTQYDLDEVHLSPDGKWVAYGTNETGSWEVYVASFPDFKDKRQVSNSGGGQGVWSRDGNELFYLAPDGGLMTIVVKAGDRLETGIPRLLFKPQLPLRMLFLPYLDRYCVTADGQRFLFLGTTTPPIHVILNWTNVLAEK